MAVISPFHDRLDWWISFSRLRNKNTDYGIKIHHSGGGLNFLCSSNISAFHFHLLFWESHILSFLFFSFPFLFFFFFFFNFLGEDMKHISAIATCSILYFAWLIACSNEEMNIRNWSPAADNKDQISFSYSFRFTQTRRLVEQFRF